MVRIEEKTVLGQVLEDRARSSGGEIGVFEPDLDEAVERRAIDDGRVLDGTVVLAVVDLRGRRRVRRRGDEAAREMGVRILRLILFVLVLDGRDRGHASTTTPVLRHSSGPKTSGATVVFEKEEEGNSRLSDRGVGGSSGERASEQGGSNHGELKSAWECEAEERESRGQSPKVTKSCWSSCGRRTTTGSTITQAGVARVRTESSRRYFARVISLCASNPRAAARSSEAERAVGARPACAAQPAKSRASTERDRTKFSFSHFISSGSSPSAAAHRNVRPTRYSGRPCRPYATAVVKSYSDYCRAPPRARA